MNFDTFVSDVCATVVGGALLTILFFLLREKVFPMPNIVGKWHFQVCTVNSSYNPYLGMKLRYEAIIWREGNRIMGSVEKVYEDSSSGVRPYVGEKRSRGRVDGYIEKKIFSKDSIFINIIEDGARRQSATCHKLKCNGLDMVGTFDSLVACQDGVVTWQREPF